MWCRSLGLGASVAVALVLFFAAGCGDFNGNVEWERSVRQAESEPVGESFSFEQLREKAGVAIITLRQGQPVGSGEIEVVGKYDHIPSGWRLFAFLADRYAYYMQYPPVQLQPGAGTFSQRNILVGEDITELHICVVSPQAGVALDSRARRNDWTGMPVLPDGVVICDTVQLNSRE